VYLIPTNPFQHFSLFLTRHPLPTLDFSASRKIHELVPAGTNLETYSKIFSEFSSESFYTQSFFAAESCFAGIESESINATSLFSLRSKTMCRRGLRRFAPEPALAQNDS
jgi:hypothetical protein